MTTTEKSEKQPTSVGGELVIPIGSLMLAAYYLYSIRNVPWEAQINGFFLSVVLLILASLFLIRTLGKIARGKADLGFGPLYGSAELFRKRIGLVGLMVLFIVALDWIGFTATIFLFLVASMLLLGVRARGKLIAIPVILSIGGYFLFIVALNSQLPRGVVERLLGAIF